MHACTRATDIATRVSDIRTSKHSKPQKNSRNPRPPIQTESDRRGMLRYAPNDPDGPQVHRTMPFPTSRIQQVLEVIGKAEHASSQCLTNAK